MAARHSPSELSRRAFLAALPLAAVASACRRAPFDKARFALPARSEVALLPASDYGASAVDAVERGIKLLRPDVRGRRVLLKPNLVEYEAGTMINTNPVIIAAAVEAFRQAGAREVVVGEGPGHRRDTEYLLAASGLGDYLRELRVPFVDLNLDDVRSIPLASRFTGLEALFFPVEVLKSDLIVSVAKLKTHHWAGMTAAMKNLFGVVPGAVYGWPKNLLHYRVIDSSILDLNATLRPGFAIVDAIVAMEGDGPIMGSPRHCGFVAMGADPVAVDATCASIIGLEPMKLGYLREASRYLGNVEPGRIAQRAERPSRYARRFEVVDHLKSLQRKI
jgi:uncharacterized protein (DUF362 family)